MSDCEDCAEMTDSYESNDTSSVQSLHLTQTKDQPELSANTSTFLIGKLKNPQLTLFTNFLGANSNFGNISKMTNKYVLSNFVPFFLFKYLIMQQ